MIRVLLVEDDAAVAQAIALGLRRLDYEVRHELNGNADTATLIGDSDVVILDIGLPGDDGFSICRRIRAIDTRPILMLTARSDDIDTVVGLESGADDYVIKPTSPRVLDARIKAVLRRSDSAGTQPAAEITTVGDVVIDRGAIEVRKNGAAVSL